MAAGIIFHFLRKLTGSVVLINPLNPNNDLSQISHCSIKGLSAREVMRIGNKITQVKFARYFNSFSPLRKKCMETIKENL